MTLSRVGQPGKESLGDLREGKRTLMLAHLLAAADPRDRARVVQYLALHPAERSASVISQILTMMQNHGSVAFADEFARGIARSAAVAFEQAFAAAPDSPAALLAISSRTWSNATAEACESIQPQP
jgi:geranylgeranyl diphosphate synthase, type II